MGATEKSTVEVRLLSQRFLHRQSDGSEVMRSKGDVFHIDRAVFEADIEPDRGMGVPAHNRTFKSLDDERAELEKKAAQHEKEAKVTQDKIASVRESMRQQLQAMEDARLRQKAQEADQLKAAAKALANQKREAGA